MKRVAWQHKFRLYAGTTDDERLHVLLDALAGEAKANDWIRDALIARMHSGTNAAPVKPVVPVQTEQASQVVPDTHEIPPAKPQPVPPPGYGVKQKTSVFNQPRPIPAVIGRKTD